jgi:outer membrane protein assembly factor BamB
MKAQRIASFIIVLGMAFSAQAENWPQWRGPNLNGSTSESNLPDTLDPQRNQVWALDLPGHGASTPIVWNDRIFITSMDRSTRNLVGICVDRATGKILWQREIGIGSQANQMNNLSSPSAITDGRRVFFYFGSGDLAAFTLDGEPIWSRNIQQDHGNFNVQWLYGSSPLLYKDRLYVQVLHRDVPIGRSRGGASSPAVSYILSIDPETGKDIWKHVRPTEARAESQEAYSTPIPYEGPDRTEILIVGGDCATGHDPQSGRELWRFGGWNPQFIGHWRLVPSVVVAADLFIICTPKVEGQVIAIRPGGSSDITQTHRAWSTTQTKSDVPVPLYYQGNLYVLDGDFQKGISCLDPKTGQRKWFSPLNSRPVFRASPTGADGKIYCMNEGGEVWVVSAADGKVLSNTSLGTQGTARGTIVAAQGHIYVRTGERLHAFAAR